MINAKWYDNNICYEKYCVQCEKRFFTEHEYQIYCDSCIKEVIEKEPNYNISVHVYNGLILNMEIGTKKATFKSIFKQIQKEMKEPIHLKTHSIILNGKNKTQEIFEYNNCVIEGLRNHDNLYLIKNEPVKLSIMTLDGKELIIDTHTYRHVCFVCSLIDNKYQINDHKQELILGETILDKSKTLSYYNISNDNNKLSIIQNNI